MLDDVPSFASVAQRIGNCRLEKALRHLSAQIEIEIHNAEFVPLRGDVRADVKRLKEQAQRFERALDCVSQRVMDLPVLEIDCLSKARQAMLSVVALCDKSLSIISGKGGALKKPGRVTCALIVIEAWTFVNGRTPGHNNDAAQEVCDEYWRACGGKREGDPSKWYRHMTAALKSKGRWRDYIREKIRCGVEGTE
jgi:hypothetical protein